MSNYKIIFTGPMGAGKTTAIKSLSDIPVVTTDESASDMTIRRKETTTVALDYGLMKLDGGEKVHLYGTPGQERFDFMWDILTKGGIGLVLLLDNTRADPFQDMRFFLSSFKGFISKASLVIGVTRMDLDNRPLITDYQAELNVLGIKPPIFEIDARKRNDINQLVEALLFSLDPWIGE